jgi:hypothetical protein
VPGITFLPTTDPKNQCPNYDIEASVINIWQSSGKATEVPNNIFKTHKRSCMSPTLSLPLTFWKYRKIAISEILEHEELQGSARIKKSSSGKNKSHIMSYQVDFENIPVKSGPLRTMGCVMSMLL